MSSEALAAGGGDADGSEGTDVCEAAAGEEEESAKTH